MVNQRHGSNNELQETYLSLKRCDIGQQDTNAVRCQLHDHVVLEIVLLARPKFGYEKQFLST